jgi:hypothetical protein
LVTDDRIAFLVSGSAALRLDSPKKVRHSGIGVYDDGGMDPVEYNRLSERIRALNDLALLDLVAFRTHEYMPEAIQIAQEECRSRGFTAETLATFRAEAADAVRHSLGFCQKCFDATTDDTPGSTFTVNWLFGTRLRDEGDTCTECGSVRASLWAWFLIPIMRVGTYRIIYTKRELSSREWVGRRTKDI